MIAWGPNHPYWDLSAADMVDGDTNPYADFDYWSRAAYWNADEATALSFGYEPSIVSDLTVPDIHSKEALRSGGI